MIRTTPLPAPRLAAPTGAATGPRPTTRQQLHYPDHPRHAPGGGTHFLAVSSKGHRYVYPGDALALIRSGRVGERLFDVTALAGFGYTDSDSDSDTAADLPLLVAYPKNAALARTATAVGGARIM